MQRGRALLLLLLLPAFLGAQENLFSYRIPENGISLYLLPDFKVPVAASAIFFRGGSSQDPPGRKGTLNVLKYLMFGQTESLASHEYLFFFLDSGGKADGYTAKDYLVLYEVFPYFYTNSVLWLEFERLKGLKPTPEDVDKAKALALREIAAEKRNNPLYSSLKRLEGLIYGESSPFAHSPEGEERAIQSLTYQEVASLYRRIFFPGNLTLFFGGNIDVQEVSQQSVSFYSKLVSGGEPYPLRRETDNGPLPTGRYFWPSEGGLYVSHFAYRFPAPDSLSNYFLYRLIEMAFEGAFRQEVLKDLKVEIRSDWETDSLFSQGGSYIRVSLFTGRKLDYIKARLSQARVASALRERPMDGGEFSLLKGRLLSRLLHDLESQETKIPQIAELYSLFGTVPQESALIRAIKSLNVYDLLRVAKKTLGENRSVVLESR
ncbi:MAG: Peptidase M16 inactive domain protein [Candidatus Aminicenantes bacterium ADurb.Bin508]|nr:MAG: Peptidase M16 inactive domain protein [Candidatus Aminicenantes bacterium ADurb.Bin508]HNX40826.1 insulinase family protein [Candidatus Aminicenantes bacterium]HPB55272.1 insulinase family protein [Candidatus Aminicenantes bacterium]HPS99134.1 insulinase family protein [Candidatus Aminicenantes bacterium]